MTVNAGSIPVSHWTQDQKEGGGRIIGEACHFIDLLRFLVGKKIEDYKILKMQNKTEDTVSIGLSFADGSQGAIHYFANGHKSFPKERLEVFCNGRILQLDNFKVLRGYGWRNFKKMKLWSQIRAKSLACGLVSLLGEGLRKIWKIGIHWLVILRNKLLSPFTPEIALELAKT